MTNDKPVSLFWGVSIDTNITLALHNAVSQVETTAEERGRFITQIGHAVTVLGGSDPAVKATFDAMSVIDSPLRGQQYFLVTVTASTISQP